MQYFYPMIAEASKTVIQLVDHSTSCSGKVQGESCGRWAVLGSFILFYFIFVPLPFLGQTLPLLLQEQYKLGSSRSFVVRFGKYTCTRSERASGWTRLQHRAYSMHWRCKNCNYGCGRSASTLTKGPVFHCPARLGTGQPPA